MKSILRHRAISLVVFLSVSILLSSNLYAETDISDKVELVQSRMMFDRATSTNYLDVSLRNISSEILVTPIKVVIHSISASGVTVANADGFTDEGKPYFKYVNDIGGLAIGQEISSKQWQFANPNRLRFRFSIVVLGIVPAAISEVGPEGGMVEVTNNLSEISRANIEVPENSLIDNVSLYMEQKPIKSNLPEGSFAAGPCINFGPDGTVFRRPVRLSIPYEDYDNDGILDNTNISENNLIVYYYDEDNNTYIQEHVEEVDTDNNVVKIRTLHFSERQLASDNGVDLPKISYKLTLDEVERELNTEMNNNRFFPISITKEIGCDVNDIDNGLDCGFWKIVYSPIMRVKVDGNDELTQWEYALDKSIEEYIDEHNRLYPEYSEIYTYGWKNYSFDDEHYLGIWAKNYAKVHNQFSRVEILELPLSFEYSNISESVNLASEIFVTATKDAILHELYGTTVWYSYLNVPLSIISMIEVTGSIMRYAVDSNQALVAIQPFTGIPEYESDQYTDLNENPYVSIRDGINAKIPRTAEQISAQLIVDFIRDPAVWSKQPADVLSNLRMRQLPATSCINGEFNSGNGSNNKTLFTLGDLDKLDLLPKGRLYIIRPLPNSDLFWDIPDYVDCFFLEASDDRVSIDHYFVYSKIEIFEPDTLQEGLISYWNFDNNVNDQVGTHQGTLHGNTSYAPGVIGNACYFDGNGDYISLNSNFYNDLTGSPFTFSAWVNPTGLPYNSTHGVWGPVLVNSNHCLDNGLGMGPDGSGNMRAGFYAHSGCFDGQSAEMSDLQFNRWYHLAGVADGDTMRLFVNGELSDTINIGYNDIASWAGTFGLGGDPRLSYYFKGYIDEVKIYNRALNDNEIESLAGQF